MKDQIDAQAAIEKLEQGELGNVKILMIEDDSFFSELVLSKLAKEGCIPYSSNNGDEAMSLAGQYCPDIVILDLMLPGKQGEDVLHELKENETLRHIPVIVFSNKSNPEDIDKNIKAGAAAFLIKSSTDLGDLVTIVKETAEKAKAK